jgi:hypothetical protein
LAAKEWDPEDTAAASLKNRSSGGLVIMRCHEEGTCHFQQGGENDESRFHLLTM